MIGRPGAADRTPGEAPGSTDGNGGRRTGCETSGRFPVGRTGIGVAVIAAVALVGVVLGYLLVRSPHDSPDQAYEKWVDGFAAGLGERPAVVILEPDALAQLDSCLNPAQQQDRVRTLAYAVTALRTKSDQVYLDAGHADWVPAAQMAGRLRAAGVASADGFALNVSNSDPTQQEIAYAAQVNRALGMHKRFVVDTSRNGTSGSGKKAQPVAPGRALARSLFSAPDAQASTWVRGHLGDPRAEQIGQHIADQPTAQWFGAWSGDITAAVSGYTRAAAREHKVPVLVAYNVPQIDCGGQQHTSGASAWCNPPGRQLGSAPQVLDGRGDMGLWIKAPGESDGDCGVGAGTRAGEFSPALATDLIAGGAR